MTCWVSEHASLFNKISIVTKIEYETRPIFADISFVTLNRRKSDSVIEMQTAQKYVEYLADTITSINIMWHIILTTFHSTIHGVFTV